MSDLQIEDINRKIQNQRSKIWQIKNHEHAAKMNKLRSRKNNIKKAIPLLRAKLEKYEKLIPEIEAEMKANSRYRILGQKRKRNFRQTEFNNE